MLHTKLIRRAINGDIGSVSLRHRGIIGDKLQNYKAVAEKCLEVSLTDLQTDMHDVSS